MIIDCTVLGFVSALAVFGLILIIFVPNNNLIKAYFGNYILFQIRSF